MLILLVIRNLLKKLLIVSCGLKFNLFKILFLLIGMAFKDLYRAAREGFLVSSDLALRAQLTEFIDHKLVKIKRNIDSVEHLVIPLNNGLLKQFIEEYDT